MAPGEPSSEYGSGPFKPRPGSDAETGGVVSPAPAAQPPLERPGDQIGPFKLLSLLGEGGFGTVWLAERREPFVQRVALKLIKPGMDSKAVLARFEQERQALAVMNHPGIARVLDGGLTPAGRPYFAMEYVRGEPITDFCDSRKLGIKERLALFEQVCEAIQHAHLKGIVHRDIKPGNILAFQTDDGRPAMKVIDFGVAKAMSHTMAAQTIFTDSGVMVGTLEYMSPEQTDAASQDIDTRSDIYSLGVLLYEILTGAPPFDPQDLRKRAYGEIQRIIREVDPPSPSGRLSTMVSKDPQLGERIGTARHASIDEMVRQLRTELEWIPLKAMRKERQHRYQTALELANDIRAYIDGRPIAAAPESATYRLRKYARRNRALVAGVGAVAAALVVGLGLAAWQWREAVAAKDVALASEELAVAEKTAAETARRDSEQARDLAEKQIRRTNELLGVIALHSALDAARECHQSRLERELSVLRGLDRGERFGTRLAAAIGDGSVSGPLRAHTDRVTSIAASEDGSVVVSGSKDRTLVLWDFSNAAAAKRAVIAVGGDVLSVAMNRSGTIIAAGRSDGTIDLLSPSTTEPILPPLSGHGLEVTGLAFTPNGQSLVSVGRDASVRVWDTSTGDLLLEPMRGHKSWITCVAICPSGHVIATGDDEGTIIRWDTSTGKMLGEPLRWSNSDVTCLSFSPCGYTIASSSGDGRIVQWDVLTGELAGSVPIQHGDWVTGITYCSGGREMVSSGADGKVQVWDALSGEPIEQLRGHDGWVTCVALCRDGETLVSGGRDCTVRSWDLGAIRALANSRSGHGAISSLSFCPDSKSIASAGGGGSVRVHDVGTGRQYGTAVVAQENWTSCVAYSPDGTVVVCGGTDSSIVRIDPSAAKPLGEPLQGHESWVCSVAFTPDGKIFASGSLDKTIRLWDAATGAQRNSPMAGHDGAVFSLAFSADGTTLASGGSDSLLCLWDAQSGLALGKPFRLHGDAVTNVKFSPDGNFLASGSWDGTVNLLSAIPMRERVPLYRTRMAEVERVRAQLAERIARVDDSIEAVEAFDAEVRADPRFSGELRTAALIVIGEVASDRDSRRKAESPSPAPKPN